MEKVLLVLISACSLVGAYKDVLDDDNSSQKNSANSAIMSFCVGKSPYLY